jgi:hypothetical protein
MFDERAGAHPSVVAVARHATRLPVVPPGAELARLLAALDPAVLSGADLVEFLRATGRQAAWTASRELSAIRELARRRPAERDPLCPGEPVRPVGGEGGAEVSEYAADEIAVALRISRRAAGQRLGLAVGLDRLPATAAALAAGRIDLAKTRAIALGTTHLPPPAATAVERHVLRRAPEQTVGQLDACVRRAVLRVDARGVEERHRDAAADRHVAVYERPDGIAEFYAVGPAPTLMRLFTVVSGIAEQASVPGDLRSADQRRFDALGDFSRLLLDHAELPTHHRRRAHLHVTVAATTLLGLDEEPGELAGYGPITATMAREIAADATWRRLLTDPHGGVLLDYGRTTHDPPAALAQHVIVRDQTCRFPGCRQPSRRADIDHTEAFPAGPTAAHNLAALCRHHHRLKHRTAWSVTHTAGARLTWSSPTGHSYVTDPPPVLGDPAEVGAAHRSARAP